MASQYSYLIADLRTNAILGELPLTGVSYSKKLCDSGTLSATLNLSSKFKGDPYDLTSPVLRVVYVMRGDTPRWGGIIWTRKYSSASRQVQIGAADWWSYFNHRKVLPVLSGAEQSDPTYVAGRVVSYSSVEQNQIARNLVTLAQSHTGGNIGVDVSDTTSSGFPRDRNWYGYKLTNMGDALKDLSQVLFGQDMLFDVGGTDANGRPRRLLRQGTPRLGQQGSSWVWEVGGNCFDYDWPSDGTRMQTRAFADTDGTAEGTPIAVAEDATLYPLSWPLLEGDANYSNVSDTSTLYGHAQSDQDVNRLPVVLPVLHINSGLSPTLDELSVGDDARFVVPPGDPFHTRGLDTSLRIIGVDVKPRDEGGEDCSLTMAPVLDDVY
ncbi:hypothetical protein GCM10010174_70210 [Kutzneria viridogrisea]|uniref:Minor tail protein n=1 Tax=Kutzneria viridogrisea TaxID=47990 RepID=A0ABR6BAV1_9PSEU|nr:hypothetical protein [Kutzneria viridogrisea]